MEIKIKSKFNEDDIAYMFHNGNICKVRIECVKVNYKSSYNRAYVSYDVTQYVDNNEKTSYEQVLFHETDINEYELHTKHEIEEMVSKLD